MGAGRKDQEELGTKAQISELGSRVDGGVFH